MLDIWDRIDDSIHLFAGRDDGEFFIIPEEWDFVLVPVAFQDILPEMVELRDMDVHGTVPYAPFILKVFYIGADFIPCEILDRLIRECQLGPFDKLGKVTDVGSNSAFCKVTKRKDIVLFVDKCLILRFHGTPP